MVDLKNKVFPARLNQVYLISYCDTYDRLRHEIELVVGWRYRVCIRFEAKTPAPKVEKVYRQLRGLLELTLLALETERQDALTVVYHDVLSAEARYKFPAESHYILQDNV